jgi:hypothetical protein
MLPSRGAAVREFSLIFLYVVTYGRFDLSQGFFVLGVHQNLLRLRSKGDLIYAIDPKGKHLIVTEAGLKLMAIRDETGKERVIVRLITEGKWRHDPIRKDGDKGYAVWRMNAAGKPRCTNHDSIDLAVKKALDL